MATPGLDTVACCSPPCESTRVARTDAPCAQKGARSRVHAAFALALALTLTISRYSCYTRSRGGREEREGGRETRMLHVRTHVRTEQWPRSVSIMLASCTASRFSRENISDRSIFLDEKKKKIEFIYRHFRSLAQNYRQNKIMESRKEKKDRKKEKCTRCDCVVFPKRMGT